MYNAAVPDVEHQEPRVLPRPEHTVSRDDISTSALKVLYRLDRKGYKGYLVGGSVRDLMLGRRPKDFDIATDARPNQVKRLFRNSRIIGRRFRLAHIYFKDGIIEVATFRRDPDPNAQRSPDGELLITDDNVYGNERQDAFRRDFTVNALFYDIGEFTVIDHVGGVDDLEAGLIRCIGDPAVRFREDPVRMMRACEMAGRLDFRIEETTQEGIHEHRREIEKASTSRLTEELLELLRCGAAASSLRWMLELGLLEVILPEAYATVAAGEAGVGEFDGLLPALDAMMREEREVPEPALLGTLLLPSLLLRRHDVEAVADRPLSRTGLEELIEESVDPFFRRFQISAQRAGFVKKALMGFFRLGQRRWKPGARERFARLSFFEDSLLLLELMVRAMGEGKELLEEWRRVHRHVPKGRKGGGRKRRRRRRKKKRG